MTQSGVLEGVTRIRRAASEGSEWDIEEQSERHSKNVSMPRNDRFLDEGGPDLGWAEDDLVWDCFWIKLFIITFEPL